MPFLQGYAVVDNVFGASTFQQLHQELEVVTNCLEWIWKHGGDLDVVLTLEATANAAASANASASISAAGGNINSGNNPDNPAL